MGDGFGRVQENGSMPSRLRRRDELPRHSVRLNASDLGLDFPVEAHKQLWTSVPGKHALVLLASILAEGDTNGQLAGISGTYTRSGAPDRWPKPTRICCPACPRHHPRRLPFARCRMLWHGSCRDARLFGFLALPHRGYLARGRSARWCGGRRAGPGSWRRGAGLRASRALVMAACRSECGLMCRGMPDISVTISPQPLRCRTSALVCNKCATL